MAPIAPQSKGIRRPPPRSASFHGGTATDAAEPLRKMRRPKTQPDLLALGRRPPPPETNTLIPGGLAERKSPAKVLVNVTVQRSPGPVQVVALTEWTVDDLVSAALRIYIQEERSPPLPSADRLAFGLHYSQFSLESLDSREKLINLGSRNFFLCPKEAPLPAIGVNSGALAAAAAAGAAVSSPRRCRREVEKRGRINYPWLRFMDFLI